jgi:hypothetical protein
MIFITSGEAGTGKTHALKLSIAESLMSGGCDSFVVVAATKMAASLVNGSTFHSFMGLTGDEEGAFNKPGDIGKFVGSLKDTTKILKLQSSLRRIYIDEVGMLSLPLMEFLDNVLQFVRKKKEPFGGIQIILCGDILQLPPINKDKERMEEQFFWLSDSYINSKFKVIYLDACYRQKDPAHVRILNRMRTGTLTPNDLREVNDEWGGSVSYQSVMDTLEGLTDLFRKERLGLVSDATKSTKIHNKILYQYINDELLFKHRECILNAEAEYNKRQREKITHPQIHMDYKEVPLPENLEVLGMSPMVKIAVEKAERLKANGKTNVAFDFVINVENAEHHAVSLMYNRSRRKPESDFDLREFKSEDTIPYGRLFDSKMKSHLNFETRTEEIFCVYTGMRIVMNDNKQSCFTSNNTLAVVTKVNLTFSGLVESVTVAPFTAPGIIPHPIVIFPKLHEVMYFDSVSKETVKLTRLQFPLRAADCGNAFTTQGCSLSIPVIFNASRLTKKDLWARVYVAASRVTDKRFFFSLFPLRLQDIKPNRIALAFDRQLRNYEMQ